MKNYEKQNNQQHQNIVTQIKDLENRFKLDGIGEKLTELEDMINN